MILFYFDEILSDHTFYTLEIEHTCPYPYSAIIVTKLQYSHHCRFAIGPEWNETKDYWESPTPEKKEKVAAFLSEEGIKMQYTAGLAKALLSAVSPELWLLDWERMKRPGNIDMQFTLNCDFKDNLSMFPVFQEYFRAHQPPALIIWGKYDVKH